MKKSGVNGPTEHLSMAMANAPAAKPIQAVTAQSGGNLRYGWGRAWHKSA